MTVYVVIRRDGLFWRGHGDDWTGRQDEARLFAFEDDAESVAMVECPAPIHDWAIVPLQAAE